MVDRLRLLLDYLRVNLFQFLFEVFLTLLLIFLQFCHLNLETFDQGFELNVLLLDVLSLLVVPSPD